MAVELGTAYGKIVLDGSGAKRGADEAAGSLDKLSRTAVNVADTLKDTKRGAEETGKSLDEVGRIASGVSGALSGIKRGADGAAGSLDKLGKTSGGITDTLDGTKRGAEETARSLDGVGRTVNNVSGALSGVKRGADEAASSLDKLGKTSGGIEEVLKGAKRGADETAGALDKFGKTSGGVVDVLKGTKRGADEASNALGGLSKTASGVATNLKGAKSGAEQATRSLEGLNKTANNVSGALKTGLGMALGLLGVSLVSGLRDMVSQATQAYGQFERMGKSLQSLSARELLNAGVTQNMSQAMSQAAPMARDLQNWVQKLAIESPFTSSGVAQAYRMAQAYNFTTQETKRLTQAMIDYSAGSGASAETMEMVSRALGQIKARGKLAGGEVLQLINAGVAVDQILAGAFDKTTQEIVAMREDGLIPAEEAIWAIVASFERDFGGAAKDQANTISGLLSSLEDLKEVGLREFFAGTFEAIRPELQAFVNMLGDPAVQENIRQMGVSFGQTVKEIIGGAKEAAAWFGQLRGETQGVVAALGAMLLVGPKPFMAIVRAAVGLPGLLASVNAGWQALIAGQSLSAALGVAGLAPIVVTLGAIALALGSVVAVWVTWNEQITKTNENGVSAVGKAYTDLFSQLEADGANATQMLEAFNAAMERQNQAFERGRASSPAGYFADQAGANQAAFTQLSGAILRTAGDYEEYRAALERAARAQGLFVTANGDLYRQTWNGASQLMQANYLLSEAQFKSLQTTAADTQEQERHTRATGANTEEMLKAAQAAQEQARATAAAAEAQAKLQEEGRMSAVQAGLQGTIGKAFEQYQTSMEELKRKEQELRQALEQSLAAGWAPTSQKVKELSQALLENKAAQDAAGEAIKNTTAQLIFQQVSAGMDAGSTLELARTLGILDEQSYQAASAAQRLKAQYDLNHDGALSASEATAQFYQDVANLQAGLSQLPAEKTTAVSVTTQGADAVAATQQKIEKLDDKQATVTVTADAAAVEATNQAMGSVEGKVDAIPDNKRVRVQADVSQALINLGRVLDALAQVQDKEVTVTVNQVVNGGGGTVEDNSPDGRAVGGLARAGKTYLVGEKGPELVEMGSSGTVISNLSLFGAMTKGMHLLGQALSGVQGVQAAVNNTARSVAAQLHQPAMAAASTVPASATPQTGRNEMNIYGNVSNHFADGRSVLDVMWEMGGGR